MKALLVIDMLNDFIEENGSMQCGNAGREIIPFIKNIVSYFHKNNDKVFFVCDNHKEHDKEFDHFPKHCVKGSWGSTIVSSLTPKQNDIIVLKKRYSAFFQTNIESMLEDCDEIHFVGVCTNICILFSVEEAYNRGFKTVIHKNGVASFDAEVHKYSLEQMNILFGAEIR
ncbi:cysteine hydrolase family protein [Pectinatus frisingensis]|uniref:cysteine hydrolase family protein n=1 Tax=Pectinatus frisingensis TaxID=865 RepID=UPI0018C59A99|nr:isochorismatase family cysteine hydrolase [Pectinatus frisingensis]